MVLKDKVGSFDSKVKILNLKVKLVKIEKCFILNLMLYNVSFITKWNNVDCTLFLLKCLRIIRYLPHWLPVKV